jgi:hypothetical protein
MALGTDPSVQQNDFCPEWACSHCSSRHVLRSCLWKVVYLWEMCVCVCVRVQLEESGVTWTLLHAAFTYIYPGIHPTRISQKHLFSATFCTKSSVFVFPPKTENDHFFPPKLKSTDLVGLSGQKPNWLGSFRAKLDFLEIELNIELKI